MALEVAFANDANVEVDASAKLRKYYQYGQVMLCFTHGDKEKLTDLPLITAVEEPVMFGATKYREVHTGHKHTTKAPKSTRLTSINPSTYKNTTNK